MPLSAAGSSLQSSGGQSTERIHGRGEDEQELWKRSVGEGDELRDLKGETPLFLKILPFHNMNIDLPTSSMQRENTESKGDQGQARQSRSVAGQPHFVPKNFGTFPNSLVNHSIHSCP
jgi:hypothetical protein